MTREIFIYAVVSGIVWGMGEFLLAVGYGSKTQRVVFALAVALGAAVYLIILFSVPEKGLNLGIISAVWDVAAIVGWLTVGVYLGLVEAKFEGFQSVTDASIGVIIMGGGGFLMAFGWRRVEKAFNMT